MSGLDVGLRMGWRNNIFAKDGVDFALLPGEMIQIIIECLLGLTPHNLDLYLLRYRLVGFNKRGKSGPSYRTRTVTLYKGVADTSRWDFIQVIADHLICDMYQGPDDILYAWAVDDDRNPYVYGIDQSNPEHIRPLYCVSTAASFFPGLGRIFYYLGLQDGTIGLVLEKRGIIQDPANKDEMMVSVSLPAWAPELPPGIEKYRKDDDNDNLITTLFTGGSGTELYSVRSNYGYMKPIGSIVMYNVDVWNVDQFSTPPNLKHVRSFQRYLLQVDYVCLYWRMGPNDIIYILEQFDPPQRTKWATGGFKKYIYQITALNSIDGHQIASAFVGETADSFGNVFEVDQDRGYIYVDTHGNTLSIWKYDPDRKVLNRIRTVIHPNFVCRVGIGPDGYVYAALSDGTIHVRKPGYTELITIFGHRVHYDETIEFVFVDNQHSVYVGTSTNALYKWRHDYE